MGCDYYIDRTLVIEYIDSSGSNMVKKTPCKTKKGYISIIPDEDSDDDYKTANIKFTAEKNRLINENTYVKKLYENDNWIKPSYGEKYKNILRELCPNMAKIVKIYKDCYARDN
jgi:hypothetical protein